MAVEVSHVVLKGRYAEAAAYAAEIHATDTRKGTNISYLSPLLGVPAS